MFVRAIRRWEDHCPAGAHHWLNIANVPGLDDHGQVNFAGFSMMPKYIFLRRGIDTPFGFAISLEPEFERIDNISGGRAKNYSMETRVYLDAELIPQKLLVATNIIYLPEASNEADGGTSRSALFGVTGAMSYRVTPETFIAARSNLIRPISRSALAIASALRSMPARRFTGKWDRRPSSRWRGRRSFHLRCDR